MSMSSISAITSRAFCWAAASLDRARDACSRTRRTRPPSSSATATTPTATAVERFRTPHRISPVPVPEGPRLPSAMLQECVNARFGTTTAGALPTPPARPTPRRWPERSRLRARPHGERLLSVSSQRDGGEWKQAAEDRPPATTGPFVHRFRPHALLNQCAAGHGTRATRRSGRRQQLLLHVDEPRVRASWPGRHPEPDEL